MPPAAAVLLRNGRLGIVPKQLLRLSILMSERHLLDSRLKQGAGGGLDIFGQKASDDKYIVKGSSGIHLSLNVSDGFTSAARRLHQEIYVGIRS